MSKNKIDIKNKIDGFSRRVLDVRQTKALSQKDFSSQIGVSQGFVSDVERGKSKGSLKLAIGISVAYPDVNSTWLLTGEGQMLVSEKGCKSSRSTEEARSSEANIHRLSVLARRGLALGAWRVWKLLATHHPEALSLEDVAKILPETSIHDLESDLALAVAHGAIEQVGSKFVYRDGGAGLKSVGLADVSQHKLEALRFLMEDVIPLAESPQKNGRLATGFLDIPKGSGHAFRDELFELVKSKWAESATETGPEKVLFVLGLAVKPG